MRRWNITRATVAALTNKLKERSLRVVLGPLVVAGLVLFGVDRIAGHLIARNDPHLVIVNAGIVSVVLVTYLLHEFFKIRDAIEGGPFEFGFREVMILILAYAASVAIHVTATIALRPE